MKIVLLLSVLPCVAFIACTNFMQTEAEDFRISMAMDRPAYRVDEEAVLLITNVGSTPLSIPRHIGQMIPCGDRASGSELRFDWRMEKRVDDQWQPVTFAYPPEGVVCSPPLPETFPPSQTVSRSFMASAMQLEPGEYRFVRSFDYEGGSVLDASNPFTVES